MTVNFTVNQSKDVRIGEVWREGYGSEDLMAMYCWVDDSFRFLEPLSEGELHKIIAACMEYRNQKIDENKV